MMTEELTHFNSVSNDFPEVVLALNESVVDYNTNVLEKISTEPYTGKERTAYLYETYRFPRSFKYEDIVNGLIRLHYTLSEELALQRQRDTKADEFATYSAKCDECKALAKEIAKAREEARI